MSLICLTLNVFPLFFTDDGEEGNDLTVFYIQSEFDAFEIPHTWRDAVNTTRAETFVQPPR